MASVAHFTLRTRRPADHPAAHNTISTQPPTPTSTMHSVASIATTAMARSRRSLCARGVAYRTGRRGLGGGRRVRLGHHSQRGPRPAARAARPPHAPEPTWRSTPRPASWLAEGPRSPSRGMTADALAVADENTVNRTLVRGGPRRRCCSAGPFAQSVAAGDLAGSHHVGLTRTPGDELRCRILRRRTSVPARSARQPARMDVVVRERA